MNTRSVLTAERSVYRSGHQTYVGEYVQDTTRRSYPADKRFFSHYYQSQQNPAMFTESTVFCFGHDDSDHCPVVSALYDETSISHVIHYDRIIEALYKHGHINSPREDRCTWRELYNPEPWRPQYGPIFDTIDRLPGEYDTFRTDRFPVPVSVFNSVRGVKLADGNVHDLTTMIYPRDLSQFTGWLCSDYHYAHVELTRAGRPDDMVFIPEPNTMAACSNFYLPEYMYADKSLTLFHGLKPAAVEAMATVDVLRKIASECGHTVITLALETAKRVDVVYTFNDELLISVMSIDGTTAHFYLDLLYALIGSVKHDIDQRLCEPSTCVRRNVPLVIQPDTEL